MHFLKTTIFTLASALAILAHASPVEVRGTDEAEDNSALINMYSGDTCNGSNAQFITIGNGAHSCTQVPFPVRSISVGGR
jgi:hypothetical protein